LAAAAKLHPCFVRVDLESSARDRVGKRLAELPIRRVVLFLDSQLAATCSLVPTRTEAMIVGYSSPSARFSKRHRAGVVRN
jgi:hypothetical protein